MMLCYVKHKETDMFIEDEFIKCSPKKVTYLEFMMRVYKFRRVVLRFKDQALLTLYVARISVARYPRN